MKIVFVLSLNRRHFDGWAREIAKIFPIKREYPGGFEAGDGRFICVDSIDKVRGYRADRIIETARFYEHKDSDEIRKYAKMNCST